MDVRQRKPSGKISHVIDEVKAAEHDAIEFVKTLTWAQLEDWQRDNEYIVNGYRRAQNNWRGCFQSIFGYLHNETVNIHSHLWAAVFFLVLLFTNHTLVFARYPTATWIDSTMFSVFLCSAVFCLTSSACYHLAEAHSEHVYKRCNALDYSGIVVLIVGSFFPEIYYIFFCEPHYQLFYLALILLSGLGAAYIVINPVYSSPSHRGARTKVFAALGLSALIPISHALLTHGLHTLRKETGVDFLILSGVLYLGGALLYANRIPERFSPGTFDYFFASHQIFHVMVVLAALAHYAAILTDVEFWHGRQAGVCRA
ncbi:HlyIII-domain-containing protein [Phellopilus nigrolimitatus]|nr:HlyIII-domain-containing protein [Phellopilus nigrolimitatus]